MRKITLEVESLAVESFRTAPAPDARGTAVGHENAALGRMSADCTIVVCTDWWDCGA